MIGAGVGGSCGVCGGRLVMGVGRGGEPVGLDCRDLLYGGLILGLHGMGKTTLTRSIVARAILKCRGVKVLVVDPEGEYGVLERLPGVRVKRFPGNSVGVLDPAGYGVSLKRAIDFSTRALWDISSFGASIAGEPALRPAGQTMIRKAVRRAVKFGRLDYDGFLESLWEAARRADDRKAAEGVERRLEMLDAAELESLFGRDTVSDDARQGHVVLDTSGLSVHGDRAMAYVLSRKIISWHRPRRRERMERLVVFDEGERFFHRSMAGPVAVDEMVHDFRKRGIGRLIVVHFPGLVDKRLLKSSGTIIVFRLVDNEDAVAASEALGNPGLAWMIKSLGVGGFLSSTPRCGRVSCGQVKEFPLDVGEAGSRLYELLSGCEAFSLTEIRERLGLSGRAFKRVKNAISAMESEGVVEVVRVQTGGRGRDPEIVGLASCNPGVRHSYVLRRVETMVRMMDEVSYYRRGGGEGADLVVRVGGSRVCVEVETGTNVSSEKYMRLLSDCDSLVVVCSSWPGSSRKAWRALKAVGCPRDLVVPLSRVAWAIREAAKRRCGGFGLPPAAATREGSPGGGRGGRVRFHR